ncbi:response regulator PleD [compost metagenome]
MNGDDVCRKMRQNPRTAEVPVIFVTAESEDRVRDLLDPNRTICLEKAIKVKSLVMALESLGLTPKPGNPATANPEH